MNIEETLKQRGNRYGDFMNHAIITQLIKGAMKTSPNWHNNLSEHHKEALEMIAHKIGRIINGDPDFHDSWHDIAGYATLVADIIHSKQKAHIPSHSFPERSTT